jgi:hypothetical protein
MTPKMPRGAMPTPRSELAGSETYRPEGGPEIFVPSGEFPTPNHELAAAPSYRAGGLAPESFLAWPIEIAHWGNERLSNSSWAEEAFAKACAEPKVFIPNDVVLRTARECGSSNFAQFMQTHGFHMGGKAYLDGPFNSLNWTNTVSLNSAIAHVGPVKIGVAAANPTGQPENHWASLCGYGPLAALVDLFERHGVNVEVPSAMPKGLCYAMFTWGSIGVIDRQSLMNIAGEAWVRNPTTIVKNLSR